MTATRTNAARWVFRALAAWIVAFEVYRVLGLDVAAGPWFGKGVHDLVLVAAAGLCLTRAAMVRDERAAWLLIGLGLCRGRSARSTTRS